MMKKIAFVAMVVTIFVGCDGGNLYKKKKRTDCTIPATVVDLNGLDGCGFVFRLENGELLEPFIECTTPGEPSDNALSDFEMVEGKKVLIEYVPAMVVTTCQAGRPVNYMPYRVGWYFYRRINFNLLRPYRQAYTCNQMLRSG
jgi:hypothetical protein